MSDSLSVMMGLIEKITRLGTRQGTQEIEASNLIQETLRRYRILVSVQEFTTQIPFFLTARLLVDGEEIPCLGSSFTGGEIVGKDHLVSSMIGSRPMKDIANINYNPYCEGLAQVSFYQQPAVCISPNDIGKLVRGDRIQAVVEVECRQHIAKNLLIGNIQSPRNIICAHYDSIGPGAVDNAAAVSLLLKLVISERHFLCQNLIVFVANEELSYDTNDLIYWCHGYRKFEETYFNALTKCQQILVLDCVGNGPTTFIYNSKEILEMAFAIKSRNELSTKTVIVTGDNSKLWQIYHSDLDTPDKVEEKYLAEAYYKVLEILS